MDVASLAVSLIAGGAAFASSWGVMQTKIATLKEEIATVKAESRTRLDKIEASNEKRLDKIDAAVEKQINALGEAKSEISRAATRISDIAELKTSAVREDVFRQRMDYQDAALQELKNTVAGKASLATMKALTREDPPEPPPGGGLPPPRRRLPSSTPR